MKGLTIEQMELLVAKGFSAAEMLAFSKMGAAKSKGAERTARWRARKSESVTESVTSDGHSDASPPPMNTSTPPVSSDEETKPARKSKPKVEPVAKPEDVTAAVWRDFTAQRKTIFTETALDGVRAEAAKAGVTLNAALAEAVTRGWQSFKASWGADARVEPSNGPGQPANFLDHLIAKKTRQEEWDRQQAVGASP